MRRPLFFLLFVLFLLSACSGSPVVYDRIEAGRAIQLPRDHYAHDNFRTEWWYYTGILDAEDGRTFGFEIVFFKRRIDNDFYMGIPIRGGLITDRAYLAHFAIADPQRRELFFSEKVGFDHDKANGRAGARKDSYHVWNGDWSVREIDGRQVIDGEMRGYRLKVALAPKKPPVLHGDNGFFLKDESEWGRHGTYYISYTNLIGEGTLFVDGKPVAVRAKAWMDHEYGTKQLGPKQIGWDWFSIRMADDTELMVYLLKQRDGRHSVYSKASFVDKNGKVTALRYDDLVVTPGRTWRNSEEGGGKYVLEWTIAIPKLKSVYRVKPVFDAMEVNSATTTNVRYWEGMIRVNAEVDGRPVAGNGYMEICGAARPVVYLTDNDDGDDGNG
ncbi:MAG TPA: lipocalin-like domain-containing protein [bacterium]|nr:lipocalin-like domain-containing protein [bacterium]